VKHKAIGDVSEQGRASHHLVRDTGGLDDLLRKRPLRLQHGAHSPITHGADFRNASGRNPTVGRLNVDDDIILLIVKSVVDAADRG
jgi:hypothetical protein